MALVIQSLKPNEITHVQPLIQEFVDEFNIDMPVDRELPLLSSIVDSGLGAVFAGGKPGSRIEGIVGGIVSPSLFTKSRRNVCELFWYVRPQSRRGTLAVRLLLSLQEWGKSVGGTHLMMISLAQNPEVEKIYTKLGFTYLEKQFIKEI